MTDHEKEFIAEFMWEPLSVNDAQRELDRLAAEYHVHTEAFDQRVCTGRTENGTAVPLGADERGTISRHARELRIQLNRTAEELGFTRREANASVVAAARSTEA